MSAERRTPPEPSVPEDRASPVSVTQTVNLKNIVSEGPWQAAAVIVTTVGVAATIIFGLLNVPEFRSWWGHPAPATPVVVVGGKGQQSPVASKPEVAKITTGPYVVSHPPVVRPKPNGDAPTNGPASQTNPNQTKATPLENPNLQKARFAWFQTEARYTGEMAFWKTTQSEMQQSGQSLRPEIVSDLQLAKNLKASCERSSSAGDVSGLQACNSQLASVLEDLAKFRN
jgi:hypothetical protein